MKILPLWFLYHTVFSLTQEKTGFLVTAPNTLLTDSLENVCVSLHNTTSPVQVSVTLMSTLAGNILTTSSLNINSASCLALFIPKTNEQSARLVVRLHSADDSELTGNSEQLVQLQSEPLVVLISTDKPLYKPGQDVLFRVVSLTHKLKPHNGKIHKIWIESPTGIRIQQWNEIEVVEHGLVQLHFSLDKEPFLGQWKIKVQHFSKTVEKRFWVKEYTPSKFEVTLRTSRNILADSNNITWNICSKYSYGEIVQGDAHVEIKLQGSQTADQPSINHAAKLNSYTGCVDVTVEGSVLGLSDPGVHPTAVHLTATVTEKNTGISYSSVLVSPVHNQPFALQFQCSQYFKPGLPYKGNVIMKTMDGRLREGVGEKIQVCVKVRYRGQLAMKLLHCWNYTTDFSSHVVFALPDITDPLSIQLITLIATALEYPMKLYSASSEVMMLQPSVSQNVKPWFSQSHSYVDVWTRSTLACMTTHMVPVYYSIPFANASTPLFFYMIESRGDILLLNSTVPKDESIVHTNDISYEEKSLVRMWRLPVLVTHDMAPESHLTIYYVRSDGEVVAATTSLVVDRCFQNKIRVRWNERQVSPRQNAHLHIRASPHSICGISVIDKQVTFNYSQTVTEDENIWDMLKKFMLPKPLRDQRQYCKNKSPKEEEIPPDYELRRKRSLSMPPQDYSDHVDSVTAFDDFGVTVITNFILETRPCIRPVSIEEIYDRSWKPYQNVPIHRSSVIADNLVLITQEEPISPFSDQSMQSLVRDYFPDTWIWSLSYTGSEGEVIVNSVAPDTITSWDTKVLCVSEREGLGVAAPSSISVFMPFFVHVESPYSIKKGESVTIKVIVYNYMHHSLPIILRFPLNENLHIAPGNEERVCLKKLTSYSRTVSISAKTAGIVNMTVEALIDPLAMCGPPDIPTKSDTIIKQFLVNNDGYMQQKSQSAFICPTEDSDSSVIWELQLPEKDNLVEETPRLQFSVVADLFGPALENLDSLVLLPMGCGEQNLARLAPNLYVLKYMDALGYEDKTLRANALKNINKGYQRQLTFQRSDGSFSAFGNKDESGSMWLTAAVVKTLSEAASIIDVDKKMLQDGVLWIARQQLENGCFPTVGQVFHRNIEGEETEEATGALSALVIANLAASGATLSTSLKSNAQFCLTSAISSTDPYLLALTTLALTRLGLRQQASDALQNLLRLAIIQNDIIHWGSPDTSISHNIVTTSYTVMSLVELGGPQNLLTAQKSVRWIATHRNENGGFVSTQDTVVALEALTKYTLALPRVGQTELMVIVTGDQLTRTFRLTDNNKLVQQQMRITEIPSNLTVTVLGNGCALIQSILKYNVRRPDEGSLLDLQLSTNPVSSVDPCSIREMRICAAVIRPAQVTNMALLTIFMVTGFSADKLRLSQISNPGIKKWEEDDYQITFYLNEINNQPLCLNLILNRKFEVEDPLPAIVTLIDYYHPEISTSKSYSMQCHPVSPLDAPEMLSDNPQTNNDRFESYHNVDFELETPSGIEGPKPVYTCPPNSTLPNCKH